ncbi:hypothetical protein OG900_05545 [Streptomyces sp. NBC_00433]
MAGRTASITLTSPISPLSALDPVRLLQDSAQLDLVSGDVSSDAAWPLADHRAARGVPAVLGCR